MEETITLDALTPNPRNPRRDWKPEQLTDFLASLQRFGDLGGIVRNLETGHLVGGHKRVDAFRQSSAVEVVKADQEIDGQGTVAYGHVLVDGHRFAYREVRWPPATETAANLAANRWTAGWDWEMVAASLQSIDDLGLLPLTGFAEHELQNLLAAEWNPATQTAMPDESTPHTLHLTNEQYAVLGRAKAAIVESEQRDLTDPEVVVFVCEAYVRGREDEPVTETDPPTADRAPGNGKRKARRGVSTHQRKGKRR